jgi:predicted dehydrogenase
MAAAASLAPRVSAQKRIRVAVLGTGHAHAFGKIRTLRSLPQYEFVGICRPDSDEPNEGDVFRGVRWLSMDELLDEGTAIELVDVESRVQKNLEYAQKCVNGICCNRQGPIW